MTKPLTFILSDESINCYGSRIITAGIDLSQFKKNPIMLWMHNRSWSDKKNIILPIGKWENIRIEGTQLLADAVFDKDDEFAQSIKSKVEQGIVRMASISVDVITTSEDKAVLVQGQTRPTVVECRAKEGSLCDIGGNHNAIRLCDGGTELNLSNIDSNHLLPLIQNKDTNMELRDSLTTTLNLSEMTDGEIVSHVNDMQTRLAAHENADALRLTERNTTLVSNAIKARKITESQRDAYLSLVGKDYDSTKQILDSMTGVVELDDKGGDESLKLSVWEQREKEINENNK